MTVTSRPTPKTLPATGNVVEGFSKRFNYLLDRARWPAQTRITIGARRFDVVPNTFKHWLVSDRIPGTHTLLIEITTELLKEIPGHYNPKSVVAWLLAGDAVPNPFGGDSSDTLHLVDLYLQVVEVAKTEGIDFNALPREVRNLIINRVQMALPDGKASGSIEFDKTTLSVLVGMLETAKTMAEDI